jgi:F0F1-type ATP synthase assembly protein I
LKFLPKPKPFVAVDAGVSHGAELAGGVLVFFLIGFGLDAWLNTTPLFMITLTLFAVVGQFIKIYYVYSSAMRHLEEERAKGSQGAQQ